MVSYPCEPGTGDLVTECTERDCRGRSEADGGWLHRGLFFWLLDTRRNVLSQFLFYPVPHVSASGCPQILLHPRCPAVKEPVDNLRSE